MWKRGRKGRKGEEEKDFTDFQHKNHVTKGPHNMHLAATPTILMATKSYNKIPTCADDRLIKSNIIPPITIIHAYLLLLP